MYVVTVIYFLYAPHVSVNISGYYRNIKAKTDKTKDDASPFTIQYYSINSE